MSEQPLIQTPSFDQIVKGNVCIKKSSKDEYRITFSKIGKFLLYQVWDKDSVDLNKKRSVGYVSAKEWVKAFNGYNKDINGKQPLFTPTTIMETENGHVYAFIIHTASLNSCGKVVFTVSTNEISLQDNTSKKLVRLPEGKCNNVRFDIDKRLGTAPGPVPAARGAAASALVINSLKSSGRPFGPFCAPNSVNPVISGIQK